MELVGIILKVDRVKGKLRTLAVIPARGGSKRIPNKNIKKFAGRPIISYAITNAVNSGLFHSVVVSTDSPEIAGHSLRLGAEVPFLRSAELSDDYCSSDQVVLDTIKQISLRGLNFDLICCIYATTPFLEASDLKKGLNQILESGSDFLIGATKVRIPMERTYLKLSESILAPSDPSAYLRRSQDLPERYVDSGQFYWGTNEGWERVVNFGIGTPAFTELTWEKSLDIDTLEDWEIAESVFQNNHHSRKFPRIRLK
jgi:pseudaminic acid cytidylyltransferase